MNKSPYFLYHSGISVLIDTWWNVNHSKQKERWTELSFNRYMVECEYVESGSRSRLFQVLIDTWWNVNTEKKLSSLETIEF